MGFIPSRSTRLLQTGMTISDLLRKMGFPHYLADINLYLGAHYSGKYDLDRTKDI